VFSENPKDFSQNNLFPTGRNDVSKMVLGKHGTNVSHIPTSMDCNGERTLSASIV